MKGLSHSLKPSRPLGSLPELQEVVGELLPLGRVVLHRRREDVQGRVRLVRERGDGHRRPPAADPHARLHRLQPAFVGRCPEEELRLRGHAAEIALRAHRRLHLIGHGGGEHPQRHAKRLRADVLRGEERVERRLHGCHTLGAAPGVGAALPHVHGLERHQFDGGRPEALVGEDLPEPFAALRGRDLQEELDGPLHRLAAQRNLRARKERHFAEEVPALAEMLRRLLVGGPLGQIQFVAGVGVERPGVPAGPRVLQRREELRRLERQPRAHQEPHRPLARCVVTGSEEAGPLLQPLQERTGAVLGGGGLEHLAQHVQLPLRHLARARVRESQDLLREQSLAALVGGAEDGSRSRWRRRAARWRRSRSARPTRRPARSGAASGPRPRSWPRSGVVAAPMESCERAASTASGRRAKLRARTASGSGLPPPARKPSAAARSTPMSW